MPICPQQDFQAYFKENMEALGLTVPTTLFHGLANAAAMIAGTLPLWFQSHFMQHSEILNERHPARIAYATKARQ